MADASAALAPATENPKQTSSAYDSQIAFWQMVEAILGGVETMRSASIQRSNKDTPVAGPKTPVDTLHQLPQAGLFSESPYLPKFENESGAEYNRRRGNAPMTNIYSDVSSDLAGKPFSKQCEVAEDEPEVFKDFSKDVDGQGTDLHSFAKSVFKKGLDKGLHWILVDYTRIPQGVTLADARGAGARPLWVHVPVERMLAVYSAFFKGAEQVVHARIYEPEIENVGFSEIQVERVRVLNREPIFNAITGAIVDYGPATFQIWEASKDDKGDEKWSVVDAGPLSIGVIALVPFRTGERCGVGWMVEPPLRDLAHMQVEEFQKESNLKTIEEQTAYPMLVGEGIKNPGTENAHNRIPGGPKTVLFAPPNSEGQNPTWRFIEPTGTSLTFLKDRLEKHKEEMRDLGKQPLATANLTVVTTANVSMRAHSAVQAWALGLKWALKLAFKFTAMWLRSSDDEVEVNVHTDFGVDIARDAELTVLKDSAGAGILSKMTVREEYHRRGVLADDWTEEEEQERLADESEGLAGEELFDPTTGKPIQVDAQGNPIAPPPGGPPKANGNGAEGPPQ